MATVVDDCCGIIKLRIGCFIIGYLNLVGTIYMMFDAIFSIKKGKDLMQKYGSTAHSSSILYSIGKHLTIIYSVILVASILELIFTVLLLVGLHKYRRGFVKAHLIFNCIFLIIYVIGFILYLTSGMWFLLYLILDLIGISLTVYFLLVIRSYYIEMGKKLTADNECDTS